MRLRRKPWVDKAIHDFDDFVFPKDAPASEEQQGRWAEVFGREAPLYVELGTGKGDFISQMAEREPGVNFIGIEAQQDVLYAAAKKVAAMELKNVRLLVFDIHEIERIFAPGEVDRFFLNFCDPWPKKRHYKRRLTYRGFLEKYRHLLKQGGELHFKTDNRPLFDFSLKEFEAAELPVRDVSYDLHAENRPDNIMTEYERKFSGFGEKINRCEVIFP
ncbi:MAG: tRNA (guanosine(46)-N7)-methyltransferase TrmB [Veillonellaceae bacterium]|uniref:tRNA (guanosine(46)-N7)-methyltransferase TrmB n=1 Tax=uncultured Selenomonas sp. TaxID=159275 RepID=UPI0025D981D2|nr:tRNA (guanosine(46)-N7)-methyltransferase TrmB [uncultured Selenomonas sp.]MCI7540171.1 tRNA (guanosine(46)-N7)-methyltransferase TrmB [Veillonellaceae bacterium]MDD6128480.1 tRNA (guanosine(46)-N7)-methyltransferase TrmB [Veillonellaceae bacterium]MDD6699280.1 tRNA (guanosine(46)-N7)-methyltransferase TrmB [Veillonellaceae bacterium]MDY6349342.1 tRNA (guanosine(46)-N7)-methyltransferase TrmB [Selenomonas sp.]